MISWKFLNDLRECFLSDHLLYFLAESEHSGRFSIFAMTLRFSLVDYSAVRVDLNSVGNFVSPRMILNLNFASNLRNLLYSRFSKCELFCSGDEL